MNLSIVIDTIQQSLHPGIHISRQTSLRIDRVEIGGRACHIHRRQPQECPLFQQVHTERHLLGISNPIHQLDRVVQIARGVLIGEPAFGRPIETESEAHEIRVRLGDDQLWYPVDGMNPVG